jgi:rRNA-processing protein FCF1
VSVRLRTGVTVDQAILALDSEAANIHAYTASTSYDTDITVRSNVARDLYVRWSIEAESRLLGSFHRDEVISIFSNPRHRDISLMPAGEQLNRSVYAEVESKRTLFESTSRELKEMRSRLAKSPGLPSVVDTNFMVHCLRPDQIKWKSEVDDIARLVVPLRVIEELDAMKTDNKERLRKNSREILSWLESLFSGSDTGPVKIRADEETTIEILLSERPRYRPTGADEEVLDVCHDFQRFVGNSLLVTADYGMRLRARSESINVLLMPQKYFKKNSDFAVGAESSGEPSESEGATPR